MFNNSFYPTPKNIVAKMLQPYLKKINELTILEPSAGKGDILDYINDQVRYFQKSKIYCVEPNADLKEILNGKGYKVIAEDFLNYHGDYYFDLILMNPPFDKGDQHLLKAWDVLHDGEICCLLNAETIFNPYTERRKLLVDIINANGTCEFLGNCFSDAERETDIEVVMVRLKKKAAKGKFDFEFQNISRESQVDIGEDNFQNSIISMDIIETMIAQYGGLKQSFVDYMKAYAGMGFYSRGLLTEHISIGDILKNLDGSRKERYNGFTDAVKLEMWKVIFKKIGMERYLTNNVQKNFSQFVQHQGSLDFTKENIRNLIKTLILNSTSILEQAVIEVFDIFTQYHKENRCHIEGWKTNDAWKVNKKIILPYWVNYGAYMSKDSLRHWGDNFSLNHSRWSEYADIDKVMCFISGKKYETCYTLHESLRRKFDVLGKVYPNGSFPNTGESEFFEYRFFKKGTLHITFKDEWLWQEFNMRACAGKNWLPEAEKKEWEESKQKQNPITEESKLLAA